MLKAIKIRLYPNKEQSVQFNKLLGCYRFVYNCCLEHKINAYNNYKVSDTLASLGHYFHGVLLKDERYVWLKEQNTKVLKQSIIDMLNAYKRFFKEHKGFPKYKSKHERKLSCRFPIDAISKRNDYASKRLSLANIKNIKFRCSGKYAKWLSTYKKGIKSATLSRTCSGNYFLSVLVDFGDIDLRLPSSRNSIGIDLGVKDFVITSTGETIPNLHFKKSQKDRLKRLQRQLSRKKSGSNNRNKTRIRIAKLSERMANRKQYYLHKVSNHLINENQVICMEDLNVNGMLRNHKLAESIQEMNLGEFTRILEYKCKWYGRELVKVGRFFPSSKRCNHCGYVNKGLKLSDREWVCPQCGRTISRDHNAALNILDEGIKILIGGRTAESKPLENPTVDDRCESDLKSSGSVKKEVSVNFS